jgi:stage V sporulation protein B
LSRGNSFVKGALILGAAGISVRLLGAVLRVFLAAVMGDEGIGLYQMAYPVYTTLLAISTAGLPIAVSKLVAEHMALKDYRGAYQVFKTAFVVLTILGAFFSLLLFFGADYIIKILELDPRAYYPLVSISPAIFIASVMSAFRGFFQGQQEMRPTAFSQIFEQAARVVVVLVLVFLLIPRGLEFAAAGATFGAAAGAFVSLVFLLIIFLRRREAIAARVRGQTSLRDFHTLPVLYRLAAFSIPITLGSLIIPLINMLDLAVVPLRLHEAGFSREAATALYGQLTGMANTLIQFPIILTIALAMSMVPAISEAQALRNNTLIRGRTELAVRLTLFFSIPAALGLFVLAEPATLVLFDNISAAFPLRILSFGIVFLSLYTTTSGILQGLGHTFVPVRNMFFGALVKVVLSWYLTAMPELNIGGAAISTLAGFSLSSFLNLWQVGKLTKWRFPFVDLILKPLAAALVMAWGASLFYRLFTGLLEGYFSLRLAQAGGLLVAIMLGICIYVIVLFLLGGVRAADLRAIPRLGPPLLSWARRLRMLRD